MTKRILILMSDTGGGHRASAEALKAAFQERYGSEFQVDIVDLWMKHTPWPLNQVPKSYRFLAIEAPWLWKRIYKIGERREVTRPVMRAASGWVRRPVRKAIWRYDPDLIIAVHPLLQEPTLRILAWMRRRIPFITVITDLATIHPTWLQRNVTLCFVPSREARRCALNAGLRPDQLRQYGLPIRPVFAQEPLPKEMVRQQLGLQRDSFTVLLVSGGEGMGPVGDIARAVAQRLSMDNARRGRPVAQLVVICGRNRKLCAELGDEVWPIPTVVNGFVSNMADWMAASDCVITKAGPGTIAEALARGLPIVLSGYIIGQEEGNVPYVLNNGVGLYSEDPQRIAEIVSGWFGPKRAEMEEMARRARILGRPQAAFQIIEEIAKTLSTKPALKISLPRRPEA